MPLFVLSWSGSLQRAPFYALISKDRAQPHRALCNQSADNYFCIIFHWVNDAFKQAERVRISTTESEQGRRCQFPDSPLACGSNRRQIADTGNVGIPSGHHRNHHRRFDGPSSPNIDLPVAKSGITVNPSGKII